METPHSPGPRSEPEQRGGESGGESGTSAQTDSRVQGPGPRLSKVNLFTLLSLWMELFPKKKTQRQENGYAGDTGLVVVQDQRVLGLHCSGSVHAGQVAVIRHGTRLKGCDLYFSRKPCSTCLKMIINAGVNRISYWPTDAEISLLSEESSAAEEARLDAQAAERLKSNSRAHICVMLKPLANSMLQFVEETSRNSDFLGRIAADNQSRDIRELFLRDRRRNWDHFSKRFLIEDAEQHRKLLKRMGLENFSTDPYFRTLRQNMKDLIKVLASVVASLPVQEHEYGFYETDSTTTDNHKHSTLPQEVVQHCIIQASLLAYRTEDPKVGVGTVIWAEDEWQSECDGTGTMYLVGCGYNAYPSGSKYAEFPQMDTRQEQRCNRKYRYIIHAEQNALTFRSTDVRGRTMLFVTKCPCDECVPLIRGAGIKQIYTSDLDSGKDKHDISYMRFSQLSHVQKFIWQKLPVARSATEKARPPLANGSLKHRREEDTGCQNKRQRT